MPSFDRKNMGKDPWPLSILTSIWTNYRLAKIILIL